MLISCIVSIPFLQHRVKLMDRCLFGLLLLLLGMSAAYPQTDVLIDIDTGRTTGIFSRSPVYQRAIVSKPAQPGETALLFFRGGYSNSAQIESVADKERHLLHFMRLNQRLFREEGVTLVIVACPTDQWDPPGKPPNPSSCYDGYRSSKQHADDVRSVIARLRDEHGLRTIYLMGHSAGTVSSRWLAYHLGNEIAGSIHSASVNPSNSNSYGGSLRGFQYQAIKAPMLHVHHEADACAATPYSAVKVYAEGNLLTVRGGTADGDVCLGRHHHSYQEREEIVVRSIISWIKGRRVDPVIGE